MFVPATTIGTHIHMYMYIYTNINIYIYYIPQHAPATTGHCVRMIPGSTSFALMKPSYSFFAVRVYIYVCVCSKYMLMRRVALGFLGGLAYVWGTIQPPMYIHIHINHTLDSSMGSPPKTTRPLL